MFEYFVSGGDGAPGGGSRGGLSEQMGAMSLSGDQSMGRGTAQRGGKLFKALKWSFFTIITIGLLKKATIRN